MDQRFYIVSGKTRKDLLDSLNNTDNEYGRVIYVEKDKTGYYAIIDTHMLVVTPVDIDEEEIERRENNKEILQRIPMNTIDTA